MPSRGRENRRRAGWVPGLAGSQSKGGRAGRVVATVIVALAGALAISGCETNAQRSAKLEKERLEHPVAAQKGLVVTRESPHVKVVEAVAVHDENGIAVVVSLRNTSTGALRNAPIAIAVSDAAGRPLYKNNAPGLDPTLVSVPLLEPGRETVWVDDQIPATATAPARVSALVGEPAAKAGGRAGKPAGVSRATPQLSVRGVHLFEDPSNGVGEEGTVLNPSKVTQQKLVVYAVGRRAGRIVAAGRAVLPEVAAGGSVPFQVFFIGDPRGTQLQVSAPASTL
jgi:hypothetical protein